MVQLYVSLILSLSFVDHRVVIVFHSMVSSLWCIIAIRIYIVESKIVIVIFYTNENICQFTFDFYRSIVIFSF